VDVTVTWQFCNKNSYFHNLETLYS